jgi:cyclopropane fatty-acyl-phospholipid synthase-like methyltransferase
VVFSALHTRYTDFLPYDQHHYNGTDAVDEMVAKAGITEKSRVINVGSGLGGPARYLAGKVSPRACRLCINTKKKSSIFVP